MQTTQIQLKISLSEQLNSLLLGKAERLGLPLTQYVKHIIIKEVEKEEYPTYQMSERTKRALKKAIKEKMDGKLVKVEDLDAFFKQL